jgi:septum formation protein
MPNRVKQDTPSFILGSASPRRLELLEQMGCQFTVQAADIDESLSLDEAPVNYVKRLAQQKAQMIAKQMSHRNAVILAADTIATQNGKVFGKPRDQHHAFEIWDQLSGSQHQVVTAVCLHSPKYQEVVMVSSDVEFDVIDQAQMQRYWQSGEPLDKAGGYAIQGLASAWVKLIRGSYSNVVGLPLRETNRLLKKVGHNWL